MAERITNQDASEMAKAIMATAEQGRREFAERTGCDCCDPTSDSPDPVVVRLEAEMERLTAGLHKANKQAEHFEREWLLRGDDLEDAAIDLAQAKRERDSLQSAVDQLKSTPEHYLRGVVNVLASKLAHYTGKTVPTEITGAESVVDENKRLRAILLSDTVTEQCGHARKWLAHRDPIDLASPTYCTFCEMARLRGLLLEMVEHLNGHPYYSGWAAEWHTRAQAALEGKP